MKDKAEKSKEESTTKRTTIVSNQKIIDPFFCMHFQQAHKGNRPYYSNFYLHL